jgi:hypothetical protein
MGLDLQQRIAQLQQKIGAKETAGKTAAGLQKKLAKLLNKLGAGNTLAGAALTLGIAALVVPSGSESGGPESTTPPGTSVVGSNSGGTLVWGVTIGNDSSTPGNSNSNNTGSSTGSSFTPLPPGDGWPDSSDIDGASTGTGSASGDAAGVGSQDTASADGISSGSPDTNVTEASPPSVEGIE